jgi:predicted transcriptional regulator
MFNHAIISAPAPPLHPSDTVDSALRMMEELRVNFWPVVEEGVYKGLLSEEVLLDADMDAALAILTPEYLPYSIGADEHFLAALRLMTERRLDIIPATTPDNEYVGIISQGDLLQQLATHTGSHMPGALLVLEVSPADFSPGEISRLIETNNAQIRQLNTRFDEDSGLYQVTIRINKQEVSDVIATFQRYDYRVTYFLGEEQYENELRRNYHNLLHFLEM